MALAGLGIAGVAFGLSVLGLNFLPWWIVAALVTGGVFFIAAYLVHARHTPNPALDLTLFRLPTFFASVTGGLHLPARAGRAAVSAAADAAGRLRHDTVPVRHDHLRHRAWRHGMKWATASMLRRFGFRTILVANAVISACFLAVCATFTINTPIAVMVGLLFTRRLFPLAAVHQHQHHRLCRGGTAPDQQGDGLGQRRPATGDLDGVALGALAVETTVHLKGTGIIEASDFPPRFPRRGSDFGAFDLHFCQIAGRCRGGNGRPAAAPTEASDQRAG